MPGNIVGAGRRDVDDGRMLEVEFLGHAKAPRCVDGCRQPQHTVIVRRVDGDLGGFLLQHARVIAEHVAPHIGGDEDHAAEFRFLATCPQSVDQGQQRIEFVDAPFEIPGVAGIGQVRARGP